MIESRDTRQQSFLGNYVYDAVVPKDNLLSKINRTVDFSFVSGLCKDAYCVDNGRPAWSPLLMFKTVFLQFLYDLSDYRIEEELNDRLSFRMFIGLDVEEAPPDHSTICRFRDRLGSERFKDIFNRIVDMARRKGLVSDKLHILDATSVKAKVDLYRVKEEHKENESDDTYIDDHSPDKDARFGRKHKGKRFYGYKTLLAMDAESELLVGAEAAPANVKEYTQLEALEEASPPPQALTADKAYDCQDSHEYLSSRRIRNGIIVRKNHTRSYLKEHIKRISNIAKRYRKNIEHKFAEMKKHHGMRVARYWGRAKMRIQAFMTAIAVNVKRMAKLLCGGAEPSIIRLRRAAA